MRAREQGKRRVLAGIVDSEREREKTFAGWRLGEIKSTAASVYVYVSSSTRQEEISSIEHDVTSALFLPVLFTVKKTERWMIVDDLTGFFLC
jgi:hypothetical protein